MPPRAESECEGLDRDFLLAPCSTAIVLDTVVLVQCLRGVGLLFAVRLQLSSPNPTAKRILRPSVRVSTESSRRPDPRRQRGEQEFKIGIEWERFGEGDNTLWTNHPELSGVCERGWNERIGKHSLATTNNLYLSHPPFPFACIGLSLGGEVVQRHTCTAARDHAPAEMHCTTTTLLHTQAAPPAPSAASK